MYNYVIIWNAVYKALEVWNKQSDLEHRSTHLKYRLTKVSLSNKVESEVRTVNPNQFGLIAQFELRGESLTHNRSARLTTHVQTR